MPKLEVEDSVNEFLRDAKDDAISNYVDPDVEPEDIPAWRWMKAMRKYLIY